VDTKVLDKLTVTYDPRVRYSSFRFHITEELAAKVPEYEKENATGGLFIYKGDPSVSPTYCGAMKVEGDFGKLLYTPFSTLRAVLILDTLSFSCTHLRGLGQELRRTSG